MSNIHNHLYLCLNCHNLYDSSWDNAQQMNVWITALNRIKKFKHLVIEELPLNITKI